MVSYTWGTYTAPKTTQAYDVGIQGKHIGIVESSPGYTHEKMAISRAYREYFSGNKLIGNLNIEIRDAITPATIRSLWILRIYMEYGMRLAALETKFEIYKSFVKMQQENAITNPVTLREKRWYGRGGGWDMRALVLSGELERAVMDFDSDFVTTKAGHKTTYSIRMHGQFPHYMFLHEKGYKSKVTPAMRKTMLSYLGWTISGRRKVITVQKRPFFERALKKFPAMIGKRIQWALKMAQKEYDQPTLPELRVISDVPVDLMKYDVNYGKIGLALFLVPPPFSSSVLPVWGMAGDISSLIEGHFTTNLALMYARAMVLGRAQVTKKMIRRRVRRDIMFKA
jgi:hypothetical protein